MDRFALLALAIAAPLVAALPASAHHSNVAFEVTKIITLQGAVKDFQWVNPHTWLHLMVDEPGSGTVEWACEGRPPGILSRAGWSRNSVKAGDRITVYLSPAKDGTRSGLVARVVKADGTVLMNGPPAQE